MVLGSRQVVAPVGTLDNVVTGPVCTPDNVGTLST